MFRNYLKIAFRNLKKHRLYSFLNTLGLGLGIACSILIFLVVRHHLSTDNYHEKKDRIAVIVTEEHNERVFSEASCPIPMADALRREYSFLEKTAMSFGRGTSLITIKKEGVADAKFQEEGNRTIVEPELFEIFDFTFKSGSYAELKEPKTVVVTERIADKYFGTSDVLGKSININNFHDYRIVGVLENLPSNTDLDYEIYCSWATLDFPDFNEDFWGMLMGSVQCFALFREGHNFSELDEAFVEFRTRYQHPEVETFHYRTATLAEAHFDEEIGKGTTYKNLWILGLIGLFLLFTACINFINMATAQALTRAKEVGVRKVLGSTKGQLFWQFMAETGLIVAVSMIIGVLVAHFSLPYLNNLLGETLSFFLFENLPLLTFLTVLFFALTFIAGAYPGIVQSAFRPSESLKGASEHQRIGKFSMRKALVTAQFAISQLMIIGLIVVTNQVDFAKNKDLGFDKDGILMVPIYPENAEEIHAFKHEMASIPGVEKLSMCGSPPATTDNWGTLFQYAERAERENWDVNVKMADVDFLKTFEIDLVAGRNVLPSDTLNGYLVNESLVSWLNLNPEEILNKEILVDDRPARVVGVMKDFHFLSVEDEIAPLVLYSNAASYESCAMKVNGNSMETTLAAVKSAWEKTYPEQYFDYSFADESVQEFYEAESIMLQLIRLFSGIMMFIAALGLYGLASFLIARKTKEIGIRKILGAPIKSLLWLFGKEYAELIALAFFVAAPIGYYAMNSWLENYAYRIDLSSKFFISAIFFTAMLTMITVGFQSIRAALAHPVKALRDE